jgi:DNA-binding phage protein
MAGGVGNRLDSLAGPPGIGGLSVGELAKKANVSRIGIINLLESGGNCDPTVTQRILDALGPPVALTSNTQANPTVF